MSKRLPIYAFALLSIWLLAGSGLLLERHVCLKKNEQTLRLGMPVHHGCAKDDACCDSDHGALEETDCCQHHQVLLLAEDAPVVQSPVAHLSNALFIPVSLPAVYAHFHTNCLQRLRYWDKPPPEPLSSRIVKTSVFRI